MKKKIDIKICWDICGKKIPLKCWRRRSGELCKTHRLKLEEIHNTKIQNIYDQNQRREFITVVGDSDILDSKGDDIESEEYLENERFFAMIEGK